VLGARPVVFIVARTPDRALTMLVKKTDDLVVLQQDKKLAAVVNFLGEINDETKEKIKEFGKELDLKKVPLAVTTDAEPLKINDAAEVTVMIYRGKTVKANYALAKDRLDQKTIEAIINSTESMLNEPGA
jgi:hypothetical protein